MNTSPTLVHRGGWRLDASPFDRPHRRGPDGSHLELEQPIRLTQLANWTGDGRVDRVHRLCVGTDRAS